MTVGFEIDSYVKFCGGVVEPFDSGRCADYWQAESLFDVFSGGTVRVCCLYDANLQFFRETSFSSKISDE